MSLIEVGRSESYACKRIFYMNEHGELVSRLLHSSDEYDPVIEENLRAAEEFRPHQKGAFRKVASIPVDIYLKWLIEEGVPGYCGEEAMDAVINKKLRDPQNKYFLTVPDSYRMMRYGEG